MRGPACLSQACYETWKGSQFALMAFGSGFVSFCWPIVICTFYYHDSYTLRVRFWNKAFLQLSPCKQSYAEHLLDKNLYSHTHISLFHLERFYSNVVSVMYWFWVHGVLHYVHDPCMVLVLQRHLVQLPTLKRCICHQETMWECKFGWSGRPRSFVTYQWTGY